MKRLSITSLGIALGILYTVLAVVLLNSIMLHSILSPADGGEANGVSRLLQTNSQWRRLPLGLESNSQKPDAKMMQPIIALSLPKSGTTTTSGFINCGLGPRSSAHYYGRNVTGDQILLGDCFRQNVETNMPMLRGCGDFVAWTDIGTADRHRKCFYPGMHGGLENIAKFYPNATIILGTRPVERWIKSIRNHVNGQLLRKWRRCSGFPNKTSADANLRQFYNTYTKTVRDFATKHPSLTFVEFEVESSKAGSTLGDALGVDRACYTRCRPGPRGGGCKRPAGENNFEGSLLSRQRAGGDFPPSQ